MSEHKETGISRRSLVKGGSLYGGSLLLGLNAPRPLAAAMASASRTPVSFDKAQWTTVEAITARIIPTDHEPGAVEADCVNFIDKALANEDAAAKESFLAGLQALEQMCRRQRGKAFAELNADQQDAVLKQMELGESEDWSSTAVSDVEFFELVRALTIMGFLADPKYGGNRDFAGWRVTRYPGPRHHKGGYTPAQMVGEEAIITIWGDSQ